LPSVGFIQVIGVKADAEFRQDCRIEGIVRAGREDIFPGLTSAVRQMSTVSLTPEVTKTSRTVVIPLRAASARIA
jgi:hypothetical protein